jgi:GNAT superfamily N-acetyltransferase
VEFVQVDIGSHREVLVDLNEEYLSWIVEQVREHYGLDIAAQAPDGMSIREYAERSIEDVLDLSPPRGICYLLREEEEFVGMGAIREVRPGVCEIKRMYIKPGYQGRGFGKALFQRLLENGRDFGYTRAYLETGKFMTVAQNMYRSAGFVERSEYAETEVPQQMRDIWMFMERDL